MGQDGLYDAHKQILKENIGSVVEYNGDERLRLSKHRHPDRHETVVEAAFWIRQDRPEGASKYKTFILRGLDNGSGGCSIVSDGGYADTRDDAIEWLNERATEFDGSPLRWDERDLVEVTTTDLHAKAGGND